MMRQATSSDFETVYRLYMDKTINPFMFHEPCPPEQFKPVFDEFMARDHFWIYEHEGKDAAMCGVTIGKARCSHVASLGTLAVSPDCQGKGVGRTFMTQIIAKLKSLGIKRIDLMAEADNDRAIKFYESLGFRQEGRLEHYYKRQDSDEYIAEIPMAKIF